MRIAIYARVSTDEQKEGQTIDSQITELERFASEHGHSVSAIYKDDGWSGAVLARPDLDRLRDDATQNLFEAVLINDVDRLARDVTHLGIIKRDLERKGIQVLFRKLPAENSPTHNLMVNILGSFAEFEREMIADRTRRGRLHKVEIRQMYLGSNTSYGYRYIPIDRSANKEGFLELIPEEVAVVRKMFSWVDEEGLSARQVMRRLNELEIPARKGAKWCKTSVLKILHNQMYAGVWHYNKLQAFEPEHSTPERPYRRHAKTSRRLRPRAEWIPLILPDSLQIIDHDRWRRVQNQIHRNTAFSPRNEKHSYLLKGLLLCAGCGARYVGEPSHGRFSYRCTARCKGCPSVREDLLNDVVWNAVENAMLSPDLIADQVAKLHLNDAKAAEEALTELRETEGKLALLAEEENRLLKAYRLNIITAEQLGSELEKLGVQKRSLQAERDRLASRVSTPPAQVRKSIVDYCREAAENLAQFTHKEKQHFLRTLVSRIVFDGVEARIYAELAIRQSFGVNGSSGRIAGTAVYHSAHNPSEAKMHRAEAGSYPLS